MRLSLGSALVLVCACAPIGFAPAPARADGSLTVEIAIAESGGRGGRDGLQLVLALGERGCSAASARREPVRYEVTVCREGGDGAAPVLSFQIERADASRENGSQKKVRVTARLAAGRRATVGRLAFADGARTEIAATVR